MKQQYQNDNSLFQQLLNLYWLRPENAILTTVLANELQKLDINFERKLLDAGCGDGTFTFTLMGGAFDQSFDVFQSTGNLSQVHSKNIDVFDHVPEEYCPPIIKRPEFTIDNGIDFKQAMCNKAEALGIYDNILEHDSMRPTPFSEGVFDYVFSFHTINHYPSIDVFLQDSFRVLKPGGRAIFCIYSPLFIEKYRSFRSAYGDQFANLIERGMTELWPTMYKYQEWVRIFEKVGFKVNNVEPLVRNDFVPLWNVGLRPIAPFLIEMANHYRNSEGDTFLNMKSRWCSLFTELAKPFLCAADSLESAGTHLYVLEKPE